MFEIIGIAKDTFKTESIAIASNRAELARIIKEESNNYLSIWYARR